MVDHTNTVTGFKNAPYRGDSIKNCAACTAAGAINLTTGHTVHSSGMVSTTRVVRDDKYSMGESTEAQTKAILDYVVRSTRRSAKVLEKETALAEAEKWMREHAEKTVFAVLASGYVPHDAEQKCHWLNAILAGGTIRYFDFQTQRSSTRGGEFVGHANPATSTKPFVGVITQSQLGATHKQMHMTDQPGSFDKSVKLAVIAFPPN